MRQIFPINIYLLLNIYNVIFDTHQKYVKHVYANN